MAKHILTCITILVAALTLLVSCDDKPTTLFELLPPDQTGVNFVNRIDENDSFNILTHEYIYNGGGVGIADFNNDGLQDIFLAGNLVPNRLYLNKGDMEFEDVTETASVSGDGRWSSGVAIADINNDGWMDLYVCATMNPDSARRKNMLFINNGVNEDGIPTFTDKARSYNLEHGGYSVTAAFLDYDRDDDLDLYLLINQRMDNVPTNYRPKIADGSASNNDRLFRNNGNGSFTDVTLQTGILYEGFGLGLAVSDLNVDGWPDLYISNDYLSNDILYINNRDGTFTNRIADFVGHQSQFSMGNDAADFNNDGLPDLMTTDMLPETNDRKKTTIGNKSYLTYINNEKYNYEHQYVRNMLHLNNGAGQNIKFSEVGQLAGIHQTEWSWSPLFADFDNDGFKDLIVTNGFPKDVTDKDFANYRSAVGNIASLALLKDSIPVVSIPNYAFRNRGDLSFEDVTDLWGFGKPSFSNGAAFADLDNDGDLDYVVNNINSEASIYRNNLYKSNKRKDANANNYLRVTLVDTSHVKSPVGAKIRLFANGGQQYYENNIYRGFLSSVEPFVHFGLGKVGKVDSLTIQWSDGNVQRVNAPEINQMITVVYTSTERRNVLTAAARPSGSSWMSDVTQRMEIQFVHEEDDKIDFNIQRTLPHKFSQSGPALAVGDINGDGLEDVIVGGSMNYPFAILHQTNKGIFRTRPIKKDLNKLEEDAGMLLFDADGDADLDLYAVSGSIEHYQTREPYQDRLYLNDGKGNFQLAPDRLPDTKASGSCVRACDYDADGDLDLFVGGRVIPGGYPGTPESYLLENDGGKFTNKTADVCPALGNAGMVTDALWTDFNGDRKPDLVVVGEFMPIMLYQNEGHSLRRVHTSLDSAVGWWNSITEGDYDRDGDMDYVVGNLGLNNAYQVSREHPLKVYADDFDGNGSMDAILACYLRESMTSREKKLFPVHFWDELNNQSPKFRNKFSYYRQYGKATINDLLDEQERNKALVLEANEMASVLVQNLGNNKFRMARLPALAQIAPLNGMITDDVNNDGHPDIVVVGNDYGNEVFAGRYDAFNGLVLLGDGSGNFAPTGPAHSGFYVGGDAKALVRVSNDEGDFLIASQNNDSLRVFQRNDPHGAQRFMPQPLDVSAELIFRSGKTQKVEFTHGSGYLSQSTRAIRIPAEVSSITVYDSKGQARTIGLGSAVP